MRATPYNDSGLTTRGFHVRVFLALLLSITGVVANAQDSREDVELAFDRNKGKLYALYGQELRNNPRLQGKVVLELDIAKTGAVTACRVQSSEMGNSVLPKKLCDHILTLRFKPRSSPITITKPIDFFPAA
jgi:TonB family protein